MGGGVTVKSAEVVNEMIVVIAVATLSALFEQSGGQHPPQWFRRAVEDSHLVLAFLGERVVRITDSSAPASTVRFRGLRYYARLLDFAHADARPVESRERVRQATPMGQGAVGAAVDRTSIVTCRALRRRAPCCHAAREGRQ